MPPPCHPGSVVHANDVRRGSFDTTVPRHGSIPAGSRHMQEQPRLNSSMGHHDSRGVDADPFLFLLRPFPVSHFTHSLPYSSFLLHLNLARRSGEAKNTLGPHDLRSWRGRVPRVP